jgi:hypothetical protein
MDRYRLSPLNLQVRPILPTMIPRKPRKSNERALLRALANKCEKAPKPNPGIDGPSHSKFPDFCTKLFTFFWPWHQNSP